MFSAQEPDNPHNEDTSLLVFAGSDVLPQVLMSLVVKVPGNF